MPIHDIKPPVGVALGKAKALEVIVLDDGTRLPKRSKVRFWIRRQGAKEDYFIIVLNHIYRLSYLEFKRRFKIIIKAGATKEEPLL